MLKGKPPTALYREWAFFLSFFLIEFSTLCLCKGNTNFNLKKPKELQLNRRSNVLQQMEKRNWKGRGKREKRQYRGDEKGKRKNEQEATENKKQGG